MNFKNQITKSRIIAYVLSCLLPLGTVGFGILLLFKNILFNITFFVGFILLPVAVMVGLFFLIFSMVKKWKKIALSIFVPFVFVVSLFNITAFGKMEMLSHYENDEVADYQYAEALVRYKQMPELSEIGTPEKIEYYQYYSNVAVFFDCCTDTLICRYDANTYEAQKALLEEKYVFQAEDEIVKVGKYAFRALNRENYPKEMFFVATNDQTNEIVYMTFYDDDLDYIVSLKSFIYDDCGWKYIR